MAKGNAAAGFLSGFVPAFMQTREKTKRAEIEKKMQDFYQKRIQLELDNTERQQKQDAAFAQAVQQQFPGLVPAGSEGMSGQQTGMLAGMVERKTDKAEAKAEREAGLGAYRGLLVTKYGMKDEDVAKMPEPLLQDLLNAEQGKDTMRMQASLYPRSGGGGGSASERYVDIEGIKLPASMFLTQFAGSGNAEKFPEFLRLIGSSNADEKKAGYAMLDKIGKTPANEDPGKLTNQAEEFARAFAVRSQYGSGYEIDPTTNDPRFPDPATTLRYRALKDSALKAGGVDPAEVQAAMNARTPQQVNGSEKPKKKGGISILPQASDDIIDPRVSAFTALPFAFAPKLGGVPVFVNPKTKESVEVSDPTLQKRLIEQGWTRKMAPFRPAQ